MTSNQPDELPAVFSGPVLGCPNGFYFYLFLIGFICLDVTNHINPFVNPVFWASIGVELLLLAVLARQLYYFRLTEDELEIRNQVLFWVRKRYPLTTISCVYFGKIPRWAKLLRLELDGKRRKRMYLAGSLETIHWLALGQALQKKGVKVSSNLFGALF